MSRGVSARPPTYWPNQLNLYRSCPHAYYLKYVERRRGRVVVQPAMTRGNVTHNILQQAFVTWIHDRVFPSNLGERIANKLPRDEYDDDRHWRYEAAMIQGWIERALDWFDTSTSVVSVERSYTYPYRGNRNCPPFVLKARVDLLLCHADGAIEHVDWKTGKASHIDHIQNIAARTAVRQTFQGAEIRTTVGYLGGEACQVRSSELSYNEVKVVWDGIKELVIRIDEEKEWAPVQCGLCPHCPYYQHGCTLH